MNNEEAEMSAYSVDSTSSTTAEGLICSLANMCDGAYITDGNGFNKFDTEFGHSLAKTAMLGKPWTHKQASAALKLLRKYQRQLGGKDFMDNWLNCPIFKNQPVDQLNNRLEHSRVLSSRDTTAVFTFGYDPDVVSAIKSIRGEHRNKKFWAAWDNTTRTWSVPVNEASISLIMDVAERFAFDVEQRFIDYLEKIREKTAESRTMLALNECRHVVISGDTITISVADARILEEFERELTY